MKEKTQPWIYGSWGSLFHSPSAFHINSVQIRDVFQYLECTIIHLATFFLTTETHGAIIGWEKIMDFPCRIEGKKCLTPDYPF